MSVPYHRMRDNYYRMLGSRCDKCGNETFPPSNVCRLCKSEKLTPVEMPRTGKLLSFTLQKESVSGFEEQEPMVFGLVELPNRVKLVAQLVDVPYDSLAIGQRVRAVFRRIKSDGPSGQIYYGYKFSAFRREKPS
jgi:uncharacterized protein